MKKWIAGSLAAVVLLMAAGCGGTDKQPSAAEPSNLADEAPLADNAEQETAVPSSDKNAAAGDMYCREHNLMAGIGNHQFAP